MNAHFPDAVVALCHFCESHGPRVVMTTQALRQEDPVQVVVSDGNDVSSEGGASDNVSLGKPDKNTDLSYLVDVLSLLECGKIDGELDSNIDDDDLVFARWDRSTELIDDDDRCPACSSVGYNVAHIANDYTAKRSYVSTQTAINEEAYLIIKKACFRGFITEKIMPLSTLLEFDTHLTPILTDSTFPNDTPDDSNGDGILYFGNTNDNFTAIGRAFTLNDAKSRGFKRRYMLLVISENHELLAAKYNNIIQELCTSSNLLKEAANRVYAEEQTVDKAIALRSARWLPQECFKMDIQIDTTRCLSDLIHDSEVYFTLHRDFVGMLQCFLDTKHSAQPLIRKPRSSSVYNATEQASEAIAMVAATDLLTIFKNMDKTSFIAMLNHLCCGRQIVCQSDFLMLRKQFLFALTVLLPSSLATYAPCERRYNIENNMIGVGSGVRLPTVNQANLMIVSLVKSSRRSQSQTLSNFDVIIEQMPATIVSNPLPSVVSKYLAVFENRSIHSPVTFHHALNTVKSDFLTLTISIASTQPSTARILALLKARKKSSNDLPVFEFWKTAKFCGNPVSLNYLYTIPEESSHSNHISNSLSPVAIPGNSPNNSLNSSINSTQSFTSSSISVTPHVGLSSSDSTSSFSSTPSSVNHDISDSLLNLNIEHDEDRASFAQIPQTFDNYLQDLVLN